MPITSIAGKSSALSGGSYKREALRGCRNLVHQGCYIFGFKSTIEVSYKIRD